MKQFILSLILLNCILFSVMQPAFAVDADNVFSVLKTEFAKYYRQITGKNVADGIVSFAVDPNVSKSGNDAYSIVSEGGTAAAHSA